MHNLINLNKIPYFDIKNSKIKIDNKLHPLFVDKKVSPFVSLYNRSFTAKNGKKFNWTVVVRPKGENIVSIHAKDNDGKYLFIIQPRIPFNKYVISFPAGIRNKKDETIFDVAKREIKEETGYKIKKNQIHKYSNPLPKSAGLTTESNTVVEISLNKKIIGNSNMEITEDIVSFWATPKQFIKMQKKLNPKKILVENDIYNYMLGFVNAQEPFCKSIMQSFGNHDKKTPQSIQNVYKKYCL